MTIVNATEARKNLLNIVDRASNNLEEFVIMKKGNAKAVIISYEEYDSWKETVEILSDQALMKKIWARIEDIKDGNLVEYKTK